MDDIPVLTERVEPGPPLTTTTNASWKRTDEGDFVIHVRISGPDADRALRHMPIEKFREVRMLSANPNTLGVLRCAVLLFDELRRQARGGR